MQGKVQKMEEVKWLIGISMALVTMIGGFIARDRQVMARIQEGDEKIQKAVDDVRREYVRRDDLKDHLQSIEKSLVQSRDEQREMARRIDALITSIANSRSDK